MSNAILGTQDSERRYRANIVLSGKRPFEEDGMRGIVKEAPA